MSSEKNNTSTCPSPAISKSFQNTPIPPPLNLPQPSIPPTDPAIINNKLLDITYQLNYLYNAKNQVYDQFNSEYENINRLITINNNRITILNTINQKIDNLMIQINQLYHNNYNYNYN